MTPRCTRRTASIQSQTNKAGSAGHVGGGQGGHRDQKEQAVPAEQTRKASLAAFRLLVEYDGGRFSGWQKQGEKQNSQGVRTVSGVLDRVLHEAGLHVNTLAGSGRTDAGVHAIGQVAHLHLPAHTAPRPQELQRLFDEGLPVDVAVRKVEPCPLAFHARHDAIARSYLYQISRRRSALAKPCIWWVKAPIDIKRLREVWMSFSGFHDMSAFTDLEGEDPHCEIQSCEMAEDGSLILLRATASHFLRKQVRRMVGAAVACALHKAKVEAVLHDLEIPSTEANLRWSQFAAASSGLFLEHVRYKGEPGPGILRPVTLVL